MRLVVQRVTEASVVIEGETAGSIGQGLMVLTGFAPTDDEEQMDWLLKKLLNLRIFNDAEGQMNLSLTDIAGGLLLVPQFTLYANTKKGNRPSFIEAAKPDQAGPLFGRFVDKAAAAYDGEVQAGRFGADMQVKLINDGPVTIILDSPNPA